MNSSLFLDITIFVLKQPIKTSRDKWPDSIHSFVFRIRAICGRGSWWLSGWRRRCCCIFVHVRFDCMLDSNWTDPFFRNDAFNKRNKCWHIGQAINPWWYVFSTNCLREFTWKAIAILVYKMIINSSEFSSYQRNNLFDFFFGKISCSYFNRFSL